MGGPQKDEKLSFWRWSNQRRTKLPASGEGERMESGTKGSTSSASKSGKQSGPGHKNSGLQQSNMKTLRKKGGSSSGARGDDDEEVFMEASCSAGTA